MAEENKLIEIPESKLIALIDRVKQLEANEEKIAEAALQALTVLGLIDEKTGDLKEDVKRGENIIGTVIRGLKDNISIADLIIPGKKTEETLAKKFSFLQTLLPIAEDYVNRKRNNA